MGLTKGNRGSEAGRPREFSPRQSQETDSPLENGYLEEVQISRVIAHAPLRPDLSAERLAEAVARELVSAASSAGGDKNRSRVGCAAEHPPAAGLGNNLGRQIAQAVLRSLEAKENVGR